MLRSEDFNRYLQVAQNASQPDTTFDGMLVALRGTSAGRGKLQIVLNAPTTHSDSRSIEDAVRAAFGDNRKSRTPDAIFDGYEVEVKYRPDGFSSVPTDSYGVKDIKSKWYILIAGQIKYDDENEYSAYLIRSDQYQAAIDSFKRGSKKHDEADLPSINPDGPVAFKEITTAINAITADLARAIIAKSSKSAPEAEKGPRPKMSLQQRVGVNRVRFDIKFESALRATIREILRG